MRKISDNAVGVVTKNPGWYSGFKGFTNVLAVVLFLGILHTSIEGAGAALPGTNSVTLAWSASSSPEVTGYRTYYGVASGVYSDSVEVGNMTTTTITGLSSGVTYFFAVTAVTAGGLESDFSNELSYTVPAVIPVELPPMQIRVAANRAVTLTMTGDAGQMYDIEASETLASWTVIGTVTMGAGGSVDFTDPNAASFPKRFYRIQQ